MARTLRVHLLGTYRLVYGDEPITAITRPRLQSLLAYLLLHSEVPQQRYHVAFQLWPDSTEEQAQTNLRKQLYYLRRALPDVETFVHVDAQTLQWNRDAPYALDVDAFECAIDRATGALGAGDRATARDAFERAVDLYRGELVPSCYEEWILPERERLFQAYLTTLDRLVEVLTAEHEYRTAVRYAERLVREMPLHEVGYRRLMRLHVQCGDRAAALATYQRCASLISERLDVEPSPATRQLYERVRQIDPGDDQVHNVPPQTTGFIGRDDELLHIAERLHDPDCRLLTLIGPGGVGKTRIAIEAARRAASEQLSFMHGVYFVSLSAARSVEQAVTMIADALAFSLHGSDAPETQILDYLRERELLLVLDTVEHLVDATKLVAHVLDSAPGVKLLVTSRERLHLQSEWLLPIEGLPYPDDDADVQKQTDVDSFESVQLFVQTAARTQPGYAPSDDELAAIVRICGLVEGLPLGIELAAGATGTHSCSEIADTITAGLDALATDFRDVPDRHRSLHAVFDHSWHLLSENERAILRRLSVFRDEFGHRAADYVAGAAPAVLWALADTSWLRRVGDRRYEMHDLVRQYVAEPLENAPLERDRTHARHAEYYATVVQSRTAAIQGEQQRRALNEIGRVIENVRAGWQYAVRQRLREILATYFEGLYLFFERRGRFHEGDALFRTAHEQLAGNEDSRRDCDVLARLLARNGVFCYRLARYDDAIEVLQKSLAKQRRFEHEDEIAFCLHWLGAAASRLGRYDEARRLLRESLAIRRSLDRSWEASDSLNALGNVARIVGEYDEARYLLEESLALCRQTGDAIKTARVLNNLGIVAGTQGDYDEARRLLEESLAIRRDLNDRWGEAKALNNLGMVARALGEHETAKQHYRESLVLRREIGNRFGIAIALNNLGLVACESGEYSEAKQLVEESLALRRQIDDPWGTASSLNNLGTIAWKLGERETSELYYRDALQLAIDIQNLPLALDILVGLARCLQKSGETLRAVELLTCVVNHPAGERTTNTAAARFLAEFEEQVPADRLAAAETTGREKTLDEVVTELV